VAGYEVGSAYLTVMPSAKGFAANLGREIDGPFLAAGQRGGGLIGDGVQTGGKKSFLSAGGVLGKVFVGAFAAIGAASIVSTVVSFLGDAVTAASDLAETQSKANEIFGDGTSKLLEYAETAASTLGQSKQTYLDGAATFGIFGKSAGLAGEPLADFSAELVTLATDLASFNNTSPEQAIQAIGAALRGESEPIRAYGVLLDDATLKARAMALGIYEGTAALTPQQKVLAAQAEILAQTSTQQGDFARTSEGMANQQRILTAEMENAKTEIGTALLPVMTELLTLFAEEGVPILKEMAAWFTENKDEITDFVVGAVDGALLVVQALLDMGAGTSAFVLAWLSMGSMMIDSWLYVVGTVIDGATRAFGWIPGVGDKLRESQDNFEEFRQTVGTKLEDVRNAAATTGQAFESGRDAVASLRDAVASLDGKKARVTLQMDAEGNATRFFTDGSFSRGGGAITGRATGGPVVAGRPYIVGEREAELFVPRTDGTILNQSQIASALGSAPSGGNNTWHLYEQSDPVATANAVIRRQTLLGV
jgi:hypothetical protein